MGKISMRTNQEQFQLNFTFLFLTISRIPTTSELPLNKKIYVATLNVVRCYYKSILYIITFAFVL